MVTSIHKALKIVGMSQPSGWVFQYATPIFRGLLLFGMAHFCALSTKAHFKQKTEGETKLFLAQVFRYCWHDMNVDPCQNACIQCYMLFYSSSTYLGFKHTVTAAIFLLRTTKRTKEQRIRIICLKGHDFLLLTGLKSTSPHCYG